MQRLIRKLCGARSLRSRAPDSRARAAFGAELFGGMVLLLRLFLVALNATSPEPEERVTDQPKSEREYRRPERKLIYFRLFQLHEANKPLRHQM